MGSALRFQLVSEQVSSKRTARTPRHTHTHTHTFSAVGRLLLQARLPATRCQTISVIRRLAKTLLRDY